MAKYSYEQLKALWVKQGGNPKAAGIAAAIALAESGGDPNATHVNSDGSIDRGLWQINSVHGAQSSTDVATNAKAAVSISGNGSNWNPWSTYKNNAYAKFVKLGDVSYNPNLPSGLGGNPNTGDSTSISGGAASAVGSAVSAGGDALSAIGGFLASLLSPVAWLHRLEVVGGVILVIMGLRVLTGGSALPNAVPVPV